MGGRRSDFAKPGLRRSVAVLFLKRAKCTRELLIAPSPAAADNGRSTLLPANDRATVML
jgi:hypothetical protein